MTNLEDIAKMAVEMQADVDAAGLAYDVAGEWKKRALAAESQLAAAREALEWIANGASPEPLAYAKAALSRITQKAASEEDGTLEFAPR